MIYLPTAFTMTLRGSGVYVFAQISIWFSESAIKLTSLLMSLLGR